MFHFFPSLPSRSPGILFFIVVAVAVVVSRLFVFFCFLFGSVLWTFLVFRIFVGLSSRLANVRLFFFRRCYVAILLIGRLAFFYLSYCTIGAILRVHRVCHRSVAGAGAG